MWIYSPRTDATARIREISRLCVTNFSIIILIPRLAHRARIAHRARSFERISGVLVAFVFAHAAVASPSRCVVSLRRTVGLGNADITHVYAAVRARIAAPARARSAGDVHASRQSRVAHHRARFTRDTSRV
jgi:hypothetical protein